MSPWHQVEALAVKLWAERFPDRRGFPQPPDASTPSPFRSWAHRHAYECLGPIDVLVSCDNIEPTSTCPSCGHELRAHDVDLGCTSDWDKQRRRDGCRCGMTYANQHTHIVKRFPSLLDQIEAKRRELADARARERLATTEVSTVGWALDELLRQHRRLGSLSDSDHADSPREP